MRCDLHVHSWHSGRADLPVLGFVSEEVTLFVEGGRQLHVNVLAGSLIGLLIGTVTWIALLR